MRATRRPPLTLGALLQGGSRVKSPLVCCPELQQRRSCIAGRYPQLRRAEFGEHGFHWGATQPAMRRPAGSRGAYFPAAP